MEIIFFALRRLALPTDGAHPDIFLVGCPCGGYCTNTVYRMVEKVTRLLDL